MNNYIDRQLADELSSRLTTSPVVALLGPRQCGKSTLAKQLIAAQPHSVYLDLELPSDCNKLTDAESFFRFNQDALICIDEIQRVPDLFPTIRAIVDQNRQNGRFLLLGSASQDLLRQSSESLAGRISYLELTPFNLFELDTKTEFQLRSLWQRGGFPRSFLAEQETESYRWRQDFIRTFLEQDIPSLGVKFDTGNLRRFWMMCAHVSGQLLNASKIGEALGLSHHTVRSYVELLSKTFVLRVLLPYEANLKKRLVKSPKLYLRDSGILHTLLEIENHNQLLGHPNYGQSWETFAIEQILNQFTDWRPYFYRDSNGAEIDLIIEKGQQRLAFEFKASAQPSAKRATLSALESLDIDSLNIIIPNGTAYPLKANVMVYGLQHYLFEKRKKR